MNRTKFLRLILAATAVFLLSDNIVKSETGAICYGTLVKHEDKLTIVNGEAVCVVDPSGAQKILLVCAEGHDCQVEGTVYPCEDSGECQAIKNITSVKDLTTLGQRK